MTDDLKLYTDELGRRVPVGYRVKETDEKVGDPWHRHLTPGGARRSINRVMVGRMKALPTYHLRVEQFGFLDYRVQPYQNILVPIPDPGQRTSYGVGA